ncbi:NAD(P)H-dependent glycerol-3-phosphate dehydrogenase [Actinomycetospora sp. CA-101289]|uniref:NAD(P)H-dependent glycerol-3-phosphate dehydrogenase n=1 Tax=Actinomycetospora sp. CA-101289 TaxID=3239893 RepID=UPI003D97216D
MSEVLTILGAGAMGSALTVPALDNGHEVRLWGTRLDDDLLDAVDAGRAHPRTGVVGDPRVRTFRSDRLAEALSGATAVVLAVSTEGFEDVLAATTPHLRPGQFLGLTTKGFGEDRDGRIIVLTDRADAVLGEAGCRTPIVAIGGPCKANEVAARRPTAAVHAAVDPAVAARSHDLFSTPVYAAAAHHDRTGVEVAAALKNVYAIALGVCHGMADAGGEPFHDLNALVFTRAVAEMAALSVALGGETDTVTGLAGVGDLQVTALSGRNRVYGARIGAGERPDEALRLMREAGQTVEGVPAATSAARLRDQLVADGAVDRDGFPLLAAIEELVTDPAVDTSVEALARRLVVVP